MISDVGIIAVCQHSLAQDAGFHVRTEGEFEEAIKTAIAETQHFTLIEAELDKLDTSPALASVGRTDVWNRLKMSEFLNLPCGRSSSIVHFKGSLLKTALHFITCYIFTVP